jgi:hypothetical protein
MIHSIMCASGRGRGVRQGERVAARHGTVFRRRESFEINVVSCLHQTI